VEGVQEAVFLKGNHEDFLLRFLKDSAVLEDWRRVAAAIFP
jgi:hypothetical protein